MKVLVTLESTARWWYHESTIQALCRQGHSVRILFGRESGVSRFNRVVERLEEQDGVDVELGWLTKRSDRWRRIVLVTRALRSYSNYLRDLEQSDFYRRRWERRLEEDLRGPVRSRLQSLLRSAFARRVLAADPVFRGLTALERRVPPAEEITRDVVTQRPDVVVASPANLKDSVEIEYVKAARHLGIPSVVPVLSWDNLTTKGLIHVVPDLTLAWNDTQRDEAVRIHGIPPEQVAVTGSPFFDPWFKPPVDHEPRDAFCRRVGLDPQQPFVVYLGSSKNIASDETWLVSALARELRNAADPKLRSMQLVVRPHPANAKVYAAFDEPNAVVWPKAGRLPDSEAARQDFRATLEHAVAAVGINTSGMIDAVVANRPCVALMVPEYDATQRHALHFKYLVQARTLELAESPASCAEVLLALMRGADSTREARRRFVESFVRPRGLDVPAGVVAARAIELAAQALPGNVIEERLAEAAGTRDTDVVAAAPSD
jgi:hypothetical protein